MKLYTKVIDNVKHILPKNKIVVIKDGMQTFNPSERLILSDGWKVYTPKSPEPTSEEVIEAERQALIDSINLYDISDEINLFYVTDIPVWLDKATRAGLMLKLQAEIALNIPETALWYDSTEFILTPQYAMQMLYAVEIYASQCYNNTQRHIAHAKDLKTVEEIRNYNFRTGYPEKLHFK